MLPSLCYLANGAVPIPTNHKRSQLLGWLPAGSLMLFFFYLYWIVSDVVEARSFVMRIRTMLNRKMKLIWEEQGHWLESAPSAFPLQVGRWGSQGKWETFLLKSHLPPSMHHERMSAFLKNA